MIRKKEAAHCVGAQKAAGNGALKSSPIPVTNSITKSGGAQVEISGYLHAGEENALPMKELKRLTGLTSREVRQCIQIERLRAVPIVAAPRGGYFLANTGPELSRFVRSMRHRAGEILKVASALEGVYEPEKTDGI